MDFNERLSQRIQEKIAAALANNVPLDKIDYRLYVDESVREISMEDYNASHHPSKSAQRDFTLSLMQVKDKSLHNKVAGYWEVYAVGGGVPVPITFSSRLFKLLYVFFMLHVGEKFLLSDLERYSHEVMQIALALYAGPYEHTKQTLQDAKTLVDKLCKRHGKSETNRNNDDRSVAFSKTREAVRKALGEEAGPYVIEGTKRDSVRVLRVSPDRVRIPQAFRDEVETDWRGGLAA